MRSFYSAPLILWICVAVVLPWAIAEDTVEFSWEDSGYMEGDIVLDMSDLIRNGVRNVKLRWPNGVVPYQIDSSFNEKQRKVILSAIGEYHSKTCIRWRPKTKADKDYVTFKSNKDGCFTHVGMRGGEQIINLNLGGCIQHHTAIHEMLHVLGFYHEQSSSDREKYVRVNLNNIKDGKQQQFNKYGSEFITDFGFGYDYGSVMHYSKMAFSKNGKPTLEPIKGNVELGNTKGLSQKDVGKLQAMYTGFCKPRAA